MTFQGFPTGTRPGEQEPACVPNAKYTCGEFAVIKIENFLGAITINLLLYLNQVVRKLVRILPNGHQMKREVDYILDKMSETMTPMHYHIREVIFSYYNKVRKGLKICSFNIHSIAIAKSIMT